MKHWTLAGALLCLCSLARAQTPPDPVVAPPQAHLEPLPILTGTAAGVLEVVQAASTAEPLPAGPWAGKLRLHELPSVAVAQSLLTADQAIGVHKDLWSLYKGPYEILRVGGFAGLYKPLLTKQSEGPHELVGATMLVPGSALDWAMGTKYGDEWLPALKSGLLCGYDATHPKTIRLRPDFVGALLEYKLGAAPAK